MKRVIQFATTLLTFSIALGAEAPVPSGPQLTDPLATPQATALYRNLHRVAREGILFGHQDTLAYGVGWKATESTFDSDVHRVCGKFPAVFGWDIGHIGDAANIDGVPFESMKLWIAKGYARGGIHTISWHARVPGGRESSWTRKEVVKRLLPEGDLHDIYRAELDRVAAFFVDLKGPNGEPVPIIFRPFHEHTGDWFWWGAKWCTPDEYKRLWHFTADYLRKTKNLHHLLLCYSPDRFKDRSAYLERYPGDDYVDILGHDNYGALRSIATQAEAKRALETVVTLAEERNKVAALTETGVSAAAPANATWWTDVLLEVLKSSPTTKKLAWVLVWRNADARQNFAPFPDSPGVENFKTFERDPITLFLEDLPRMYADQNH